MAAVPEHDMSRACDWNFNFNPGSIDLENTPLTYSDSTDASIHSDDLNPEQEEIELIPSEDKPRVSLFGGSAEDSKEEDPSSKEPRDAQESGYPGQGIRQRMSSLSLDPQQNNVASPDNLGQCNFGLASSDIGSVCNSPNLSEDEEFIIPPDTQAPYQLRQNIDRTQLCTYHDNDESGNYNPESEARERALQMNRMKAAKKAKSKGKGKNKQRSAKKNIESKQGSQPAQGCVSCSEHGEECSKLVNDTHPCQWCKYNGYECVTEAAINGQRKPHNIPEALEQKKTKTKKAAQAREKKKTSNSSVSKSPKVLNTRTVYLTAEDLADLEDLDDDRTSSRETTPEITMEDQAGNRGPVIKIQTSFAHPIRFSITTPNRGDCDFCEVPIFGMIGHLEKTVHVIQWDTDLGYTEIGGGHCEENGETTMCQTCMMGRLQIAACEEHEMQQRYAVNETTFDDNLESLLSSPGGSYEAHDQLLHWCSMCFSPAVFACCTRQLSISSCEEDAYIIGCGLRLCELCEIQLREVYEGCSHVMADACDGEPKMGKKDRDLNAHKVRADVGFISKNGLLARVSEHQGTQLADLMEQ